MLDQALDAAERRRAFPKLYTRGGRYGRGLAALDVHARNRLIIVVCSQNGVGHLDADEVPRRLAMALGDEAAHDAIVARDIDVDGLGKFLKAVTNVFALTVVDCGNGMEPWAMRPWVSTSAHHTPR